MPRGLLGGGDQQSGRLGIARPTDGAPPLADAIDGEGGRVMVNADTHPTRIGGEIVDPVRHRAAELLDQEVMDPDFFRVALGAIFAPVVAEIADQFFFWCRRRSPAAVRPTLVT
jgi:hypothetical protein